MPTHAYMQPKLFIKFEISALTLSYIFWPIFNNQHCNTFCNNSILHLQQVQQVQQTATPSTQLRR